MNSFVNKYGEKPNRQRTFLDGDFEQVIAYLKQESELNQKGRDGVSQRDHLLAVERQSKKPVKELQNLVTLPESMFSLWSHFITLDSTRSSNGYSSNPLSFSEIKAYFDILREVPEVWEVQLIRRLDQTLLEVYAKQAEVEMKSKK